jgi:hypothetical protein
MPDWNTVLDWTDFGTRLRLGPDGTLAIWNRNANGYELIHCLPDGRIIGPVTDAQANGVRRKMTALRRTIPEVIQS